MVQMAVRTLEELKPLSKKLHADAFTDKIMSLLEPPHPTRTNVRLRVGISKRRTLMLYEPSGDGGWAQHGPLTHAHLDELGHFMHLFVERHTRYGMNLLCYEPVP